MILTKFALHSNALGIRKDQTSVRYNYFFCNSELIHKTWAKEMNHRAGLLNTKSDKVLLRVIINKHIKFFLVSLQISITA